MPICAFCGQDVKKVTKDHIPPKSLFGKMTNYKLITVPSCRVCNEGTSKDDEYFMLLAIEWEASSHATAANVMDSVRRSLLIPEKKRYRDDLMRNTKPTDLLTSSGLCIKQGGELSVNLGRLAKTATKIVAGLYYHLQKKPVPVGYFAYCSLLDFILDGGPMDYVQKIKDDILPTLASAPATIIGPEVFCYRVGIVQSDPNIMFFLWELYNRYQFYGFVARIDDEDQPIAKR